MMQIYCNECGEKVMIQGEAHVCKGSRFDKSVSRTSYLRTGFYVDISFGDSGNIKPPNTKQCGMCGWKWSTPGTHYCENKKTGTKNAICINKDGWDDGVWQLEPDESQFNLENGAPGIIKRSVNGALMGYMPIGSLHPFHGKSFDKIPVDVHGGLSFSKNELIYNDRLAGFASSKGWWWIGFDCAHAFDIMPAFGNMGMKPYPDATYKPYHYVRWELNRLAMQMERLKIAR